MYSVSHENFFPTKIIGTPVIYWIFEDNISQFCIDCKLLSTDVHVFKF